MLSIIQAAGWPIWPLILCSIVAMAVVFERFYNLRPSLVAPPTLLDEVVGVTRTSLPGTEVVNKLAVNSVLGSVMAAGLRSVIAEPRITEAALRQSFEIAGRAAMHRIERYLNTLGTIAAAAPLLGLLGTVVGMMGSFSLIGGDLNAPGAITGGIAEALIATAFGLGIAITALLPFNFLNTKMEVARHEMESAATQLELLVQPHLVAAMTAHDLIPLPDKDARERASSMAAREAARRREVELKQKREALQRQMDALEIELGQPELAVTKLGPAQPRKD